MLLHCYPCTMPLHSQYITHAATQLNNCIQLGLTFNNTQHVLAQHSMHQIYYVVKHNFQDETSTSNPLLCAADFSYS